MREKFFQFILSATIAPLLFTVGAHTAHAEEVTPPPFYDTDAHDDAIDFLLKQVIRQYSGSTQPSNESPADDTAVSMGGSNEFVECFCGGAVVEGGSGAVVQFVGDGVEVWLVAGDGGSFG